MRALVSTLVTIAIVLAVDRVAPIPIVGFVLGGILAMFVSVAIEGSRRERLVAFAVLPVPICATVVGAAWLFGAPALVADVIFLAIIYLATDARRFGPIGNLCGLAAVLGYFLARYLRASPTDLPGIAIALVVAGGVTCVVREIVLPDAPRWSLRTALAAFRAQRRCVARAALAYRGDPSGERRVEAMLRGLNACAISVHAALNHPRLGLTDARRGALAAAIAGSEITADRLAIAVLTSSGVRETASCVSEGLVALRDDDPARAAVAATALDAHGDADFDAVLADRHGKPVPLPARAGIPAHTKQALQATIASAAAIVVGGIASGMYWYWAVLASYIVFLGTSSAGETRRKAWSRVIGTALGVGGGAILSAFIGHHQTLDIAVVTVLFTFGLYFRKSAYYLMMFAITVSLGLIYGLLHRPTDSLLVLRLVETAIGGFFGWLAATVVFPVRTASAIAESAAAYLEGLDASLAASIATLVGEATEVAPGAAARALDALRTDLLARALPVTERRSFGGSPLGRSDPSVTLAACSYFALRLARVAETHVGAGAASRDAYAVVRTAIHSASDTIAGRSAPAVFDRSELETTLATIEPPSAAHELRRIVTIVAVLAERRRAAAEASVDRADPAPTYPGPPSTALGRR